MKSKDYGDVKVEAAGSRFHFELDAWRQHPLTIHHVKATFD
jgi:hypothetical protein